MTIRGTKTSFCCYLYTISPLSIPFFVPYAYYHLSPPSLSPPLSAILLHYYSKYIYKKDDISKTKKVSFYFFGGLKAKTKNVTLRIWLPKTWIIFSMYHDSWRWYVCRVMYFCEGREYILVMLVHEFFVYFISF